MSAPNLDFEFYVGGIEDAILGLLTEPLKAIGVKAFETYSGQLDNAEEFKAAIAAKARSYPLVMVTYTDGVNVKDPPVAPVLGGSLIFRHDCSFAVFCVSTNARGEGERRRGTAGTYAMIAKVWDTLAGLRLNVTVEGTSYLLTTEPLTPTAIEYVAKLPNMTAYAVIFETAFRWTSPNRTPAAIDVTELIPSVVSLNQKIVPAPATNLPGVKFET